MFNRSGSKAEAVPELHLLSGKRTWTHKSCNVGTLLALSLPAGEVQNFHAVFRNS